MNSTLGAFRAGASPLHRLPAVAKVIILFLWGVTTLVIKEPGTAIGLAAAALLLLVSTTPRLRPTLRGLGIMAIVAVIGAAYHLWNRDWISAIDVSCDMLGLFALSLAVTTSTPMGEMLDLAAAAARPLRKVLPPAIPGLMFAIMMRAIPEVSSILHQSREAARARGVERNPSALLIPTTTRTVGFALDLGAALHARGIGDDADDYTQRRDAEIDRTARASAAATARAGVSARTEPAPGSRRARRTAHTKATPTKPMSGYGGAMEKEES